jgi:hypothetical protein
LQTGASHPTVAAVRAEMVLSGELSMVSTAGK